jgi:hypothetical protein
MIDEAISLTGSAILNPRSISSPDQASKKM